MTIQVRAARPEDALAVGRLAAEFADHLRSLGEVANLRFTAETYLRDGFGPSPAFAGVVAQRENQVIGYLLYSFGYDTDLAVRPLWVLDLFIAKDHRGCGAGTALMQEAARIGRESGSPFLLWGVYEQNKPAFRFYERLGARAIQHTRLLYWKPV